MTEKLLMDEYLIKGMFITSSLNSYNAEIFYDPKNLSGHIRKCTIALTPYIDIGPSCHEVVGAVVEEGVGEVGVCSRTCLTTQSSKSTPPQLLSFL